LGDSSWGIQFRANQNTTLTAFTFTHNNAAGFGDPIYGSISLVDLGFGSSTVGTYAVDAPHVIDFTGLSAALLSGHSYQSIVNPLSSDSSSVSTDEAYNFLGFPGFPPAYGDPSYSNADITVTNGVYSGNTTGFFGTNVWYGFTNITTTDTAAVPEPSTLLGWSIMFGMLGMVSSYQRLKRTAAAA